VLASDCRGHQLFHRTMAPDQKAKEDVTKEVQKGKTGAEKVLFILVDTGIILDEKERES